ncbi:unnamed protein product [Lepidochelys olivacea]
MGTTQLPCRSRSFCFTFSLFVILLHQTAAERTLKYVVAIFRHGDRTPIQNFPTGLHKESKWPQGFGQLTKIGMQQQYELGQYMRKRYSNFLNATYNRHEIFIQSTDYDRTIMSAQVYLAGLFPPVANQIWNPQILWQPIPVHTMPLSQDHMLHFPSSNCPCFDELQNETQASWQLQNKLQPYMGFLKTMAANTGYDVDSLKQLNKFKTWNTYDTLLCESIHNYTLPEWASQYVMKKMKELAALSLQSLFGIYKTKDKSRLQGGVLVNAILKNIKNATQPSNKRKMQIFSAHDTTIGALQMALNIFNGKLPPYSACQFFELYQENSGQYTFLGFDFAVGLLFIFDAVLLYLLYEYGSCRHKNTYRNF